MNDETAVGTTDIALHFQELRRRGDPASHARRPLARNGDHPLEKRLDAARATLDDTGI